jgi:nucleotide-binding universal stress UspA family protein
MVSRIVVGSDGSSTASRAVEVAIEMAKAGGAALVIVRAYREPLVKDAGSAYDPTVLEDPEMAQMPDDVARPVGKRAEALASLEAEVAAAAKAGVDEVIPEAREGDPADAIITAAEENQADMIVVGNKGMTGAARYLLGSVPDKISHHAPCNVLIVRTKE